MVGVIGGATAVWYWKLNFGPCARQAHSLPLNHTLAWGVIVCIVKNTV